MPLLVIDVCCHLCLFTLCISIDDANIDFLLPTPVHMKIASFSLKTTIRFRLATMFLK